MAPLRFLRKVNRFPSRKEQHFDGFAWDALNSVSPDSKKEYLNHIKSTWHRPSGDDTVLEENLSHYGDPLPRRCYDGDYLAILKKTMDELKPRDKIIPLTLGAAEKSPDLPTTTSPGFPWVTRGFRTKADVLNDKGAVGLIHRTWDSIGRGIPWQLPDSMAFHRVIASPAEKTKIRPVWGYPTEVIIEEARFFLPLWKELKAHCNETDAFYGIGMETALSGHSHLARSFDLSDVKYALSADLTNFDSHASAWIIRDIFSHMSSWFDFSKVCDSEGKVWNVNPDQTCRRWKAMVSYFINTKIRTPTGMRFQKSQGVPSGSMFTNILDTCINAVQMRVCLRRISDDYPVKDYYYGDDSTIFLRTGIDLNALARELLDTFGGILSVDKTIYTDNVENIHWLGYYYRTTGPRRSLDFILASSLFPDRAVPTPIDSAARLLGQLYSCMDPLVAVVFYDAINWLKKTYSFSSQELEDYVRALPSKAMKYLTTLGLSIEEITLPSCHYDPFGDRFIPDVLPKPSSRNFFRRRDPHLPRYAFVAEAYQNRALRTQSFKDFSRYTETFSFYDEFQEDEKYFTD
ncbi:RNA dependent RNA polymerase [Diplodia seriata partitivirus 1]|nr:RNA dependent RNA polymerase [Diplodia seriata partitivirus 1]